jgi:MFS family permease
MSEGIHRTLSEKLATQQAIADGRAISSLNNSIKDEKEFEEGLYGWLVVLGSFLIAFVLFGIYSSYGIFLQEYKNIFPDVNTSTLSFIGSTGSALFFFLGLVTSKISDYIHYKIVMTIGAIIFSLGLLLASFADQIWQLFLTQAVLLGIGSSIIFYPAISAPSEWFNKSRGLAIGITVSGSGWGGLAYGQITQVLIDHLGYKGALRVLALICFILSMIGVVLIRKRGEEKKSKGIVDKEVVLNSKFGLLFGMGFFASFAYWVPFFLMPLYAKYYGLSLANASLLVSLLNLGSAVGRIILGRIADKLGNINVAVASCIVMALSTFFIWTFSTTFPGLIVYSLIYGASSSGLFVFIPILSTQIFGVENQSKANGPLYFSLSISFLLGSPIATTILDAASSSPENQNFVPSIMYAGALSIIGCIFLLVLRYKLVKFSLVKI